MKKKIIAFHVLTYDKDGHVNAQCTNDDAADDRHYIAGPSEGVR